MTTGSQGYYDLLEQFARPGCAICALVLRAGKKYMESLLYEFSLDAEMQRAFRKGRGLCNYHSWQLAHHHGYSLGVSFLFESALDEVVSILESQADSLPSNVMNRLGRIGGSTGSRLADKLEPDGPCLVCANVQDADDRMVQTFARHWGEDAVQTAFNTSDGVCLPHLRAALRLIESGTLRRQLVEFHVAKWTALKGELDQFQLKSAYNYVGDPIGAEGDSWKRAIAAVSGLEFAPFMLTRPR